MGEAEVSGDFKAWAVHSVPAGIIALFPLFPELFPVLHGMALRGGQKKEQGGDYGENEYVFMHCAGFYFVSLSSLVEGRAKVRKFPGPRFAWDDVFFRFVCIKIACNNQLFGLQWVLHRGIPAGWCKAKRIVKLPHFDAVAQVPQVQVENAMDVANIFRFAYLCRLFAEIAKG